MQMNLVTCLHIVSYLCDIICALGEVLKNFLLLGPTIQKMRLEHHPTTKETNLVHLEKKAGNFRVVMEEMTSFVFCQVPWENEYESSIVCFYSSGQQLLYQDRPFSYKKRPIEVYHLMATSHIIWVNFAK